VEAYHPTQKHSGPERRVRVVIDKRAETILKAGVIIAREKAGKGKIVTLKLQPPTPRTRVRMQRQRRTGTNPELVVGEALRGLRFSVEQNPVNLPGRPDLILRPSKVAIFVHGCFWHRHIGCAASTNPRTNALFWKKKFINNVSRDRRKARQLRKMGWIVLTFWECQTNDGPAAIATLLRSRITSAMRRRR
jgi:DNA mismatch endonuclease (patch repair protein)